MTKSEVLAIWGEPENEFILDEPDWHGRVEDWSYSHSNWWGTNGVDLSFDKDGKLIIIEPVYK